ncbi:glycoside hydrolase family 95 protein [Pollutibacter soli]|uniref:glycoside hydrolase family 95 protein n=1 Tax=Pollutibacter soli TaxID=3034157 RepID=UPI00301392CD
MRLLVASVLMVLFSNPVYSQSQHLRLWYKKPAENVWESALPVGNGRLGAMVYGNVPAETIQLNEHTVWSGSPNRNDNSLALQSLPEIRQLIFEGRHKEAEELANKTILSKKSHGQKFQPVGDLQIRFLGHENYTGYYRELDIEKAVARTVYVVNEVEYQREVFASFADDVMVIRLSANKPGMLSFTAHFRSPHTGAIRKTNKDGSITVEAVTSSHETVEGKVRFKGIAKIKNNGGRVSVTDTAMIVEKANEVIILVSVATNFNNYKDLGGDEQKRSADYIGRAFAKSFSAMINAHVKAYQRYFNRVKLNLGKTNSPDLPTDERLKNFRSSEDPEFTTLYFQYGRYLLISSSRPGSQPANLQGVWNNRMNPPWDSKYTININAEMNYWPAEKTNLAELHEPFLKMVRELSETGEQTAKEMYGARGWMAHHNTDIWRATGAIDGAFWGLWTGGGGWTSQHLWEHYLYSGDRKYLQSIYPILKGAALFYVDFLVEDPKRKWLVINPGMSPENAPKAHGGSSLDAGATMDNQIVFDVFSTTIRAASILGTDEAFSDTLKQMRDRLPPMQVGQHGQLQEWLDDIDDPKDDHRHISHLYGLFPSSQISPYRTPELFSGAKNTLIQRGDVSTGWSMGWKVNWWARMLDGNHAFKLIRDQLTPVGTNPGGGGTYANLFDAHPPFQIDGNFGCTSGIAEMLVQSSDGSISVLPALPDEWKTGDVTGLRTRGGFEIERIEWRDGRLVNLVVKSNNGGQLRIRVPNTVKASGQFSMKPAAGENQNMFFFVEQTKTPLISPKTTITKPQLKETFLYDINTERGKTYRFIPDQQ